MKESIVVKILIWLTLLTAIQFWSYIYFDPAFVSGRLPVLVFIVLFAYLLFCKKPSSKKDSNGIERIVIWTLITIFLCVIPASVDYGQSIFQTAVQCMRLSYGLLIFFILKWADVRPKYILRVITIVSLVWVFLELFQQVTYPEFWFSGRYLIDDYVTERMGLWRFYIWGIDFVMLVYAYWLGRFISEEKNANRKIALLVMLVCMAGLLCYCSRKHIYVTIFILVYAMLVAKGNSKYLYGFIILAILYYVYDNFYVSFKEMNEEAINAQGSGEDFIRFMAAEYFISDFSDSPLYPFLGAGMEVKGSPLYYQLDRLKNIFGNLGFYQADVGIIGYYSKFGLVGVSAILWYIYKFIKNWKYIDNWLKYFFIMKMILIIFDFWAIWAVGMTAYAFFLYLLDKNITKNKLKEK